MSLNFKIALQLVQDNIQFAKCGIFNTRNIAGDLLNLLHKEGTFQVWICYQHEYFEVLGLPDDEFTELERRYKELVAKCG